MVESVYAVTKQRNKYKHIYTQYRTKTHVYTYKAMCWYGSKTCCLAFGKCNFPCSASLTFFSHFWIIVDRVPDFLVGTRCVVFVSNYTKTITCKTLFSVKLLRWHHTHNKVQFQQMTKRTQTLRRRSILSKTIITKGIILQIKSILEVK